MPETTCPISAIVGPGRSGTTWAGTIVDSCPDAIYRFEPFHRLAAVDAQARWWFERLKSQQVTSVDVPHLYELLRIADPLTNKAPFFTGKNYSVREMGRELMWPIARMASPVRWAYRKTYSPLPGPPLVFKEVTFIKPLRNLLERTSIPVVYLARHPCATVLSDVRGQGRERTPVRQRRLRELLLEHAPWLAEEFPQIVAGSDVVSRTALLWRCEVEVCASQVRDSRHGLLMTYEQLAGDAYVQSERMLKHLGVPFTGRTTRYLDSLHELESSNPQGPSRTGWGKRYFSVHRNPKSEKDSWKRRITSEEQRKIEQIVQGSAAIERLAALGNWW